MFCSDSSEDKQTKPKASTESGSPGSVGNSSLPPKKNFVEVTELTDITYMSNLAKLRPGHMNIVLVLTEASKSVLLSKFAKEVYSFTGSLTLHFSFLNLDKHRDWMNSLLEFAQDAAHPDGGGGDDQDEQENPRVDYTGFVLAFNGHKKYFCMFKPVYTGEDPDAKTSEGDSGGSTVRSRSHENHSTRKSNRSRSLATLHIHHKLDRLGLWMERLVEGTLPRYHVPSWPPLDETTATE